MAKMRMKTSETLSIVCYILQIFLEIFPIELSVSAFYLLKAVLCVPIAVCIYITKSKPLFRILAISSLLVLSIPSDYLPNKINILIYIITAVFAGIVYVIYESKKNTEYGSGPSCICPVVRIFFKYHELHESIGLLYSY